MTTWSETKAPCATWLLPPSPRTTYSCHSPNLSKRMDPGTRSCSTISSLATYFAKLPKLPPPTRNAGQDECIWMADRTFSVNSAYELLMRDDWDEVDCRWNLAWQWPGAQRVRTFIWLAFHNRLLTNAERLRRHMTTESRCSYCDTGTEDLNHVLRACPLAAECWQLVVPPTLQATFFSCPFNEWFETNLRRGRQSNYWCTTFGLLCWALWKRRNCRVFTASTQAAPQVVHEVLSNVHHTLQAGKPIAPAGHQRPPPNIDPP